MVESLEPTNRAFFFLSYERDAEICVAFRFWPGPWWSSVQWVRSIPIAFAFRGPAVRLKLGSSEGSPSGRLGLVRSRGGERTKIGR